MSTVSFSIADAVQRLASHDASLRRIDLLGTQHTDAELTELVDCLLRRPNAVARLALGVCRLTDETGATLARYLAASAALRSLNLACAQLGDATFLAVAAALRTNTSLRLLNLASDKAADKQRIDAAFVEALRLNPNRPAGSRWQLYSFHLYDIDFKRLDSVAKQLGHPSLQMVLLNALPSFPFLRQ